MEWREKLTHSNSSESADDIIKVIAKGGGIALSGNILGQALSFSLHVVLGRVLGPASYGLYALGLSIIGILQAVSSLGLDQGVVRFCSIYQGMKNSAGVKGTILFSLKLSFIAAIIISSNLFIFADQIAENIFYDPGLVNVLRVFALSIPFFVITGISASFFRAFQRIEYQQLVQNIIKPAGNLILFMLALLLGYRLVGALWSFLIAGVLSALLSIYLLKKLFPEIRSKLAPLYFPGKLLKFSMPTLFIGISYVILNYTDRIMIGYFKPPADVGIYNASNILARNILVFIIAIISIFSPIIANLHNLGKYSDIKSIYLMVTRWIVIATFPVLLVLVIFPEILIYLFGLEYQRGTGILILLSFSYFVGACTGPGGAILLMTGRQNIDLINIIVLVITNIILNACFIPKYGALGAALATFITYTVVHLARLIEVYKIFKLIPYDTHIIKPFIAGSIAALSGVLFCMFLNPDNIIVYISGVFFMVAVYVACLLTMGLYSNDKILLLNIIKKFQRRLACCRQ